MKQNFFSKLKQFISTFLYTIFLRFKNILNFLRSLLLNFTEKYPYTAQSVQLSFIYFFALVDLVYSILSNIFSLDMPETIKPFLPIFLGILQSAFLKFWASPEKVFFMSYVVLELMIIRPIFKFSKLVKYNILLVFAFLMVQGLVVSFKR